LKRLSPAGQGAVQGVVYKFVSTESRKEEHRFFRLKGQKDGKVGL
jgi:hypothetical protein